MNNLQPIFDYLNGKKTYAVVVVFILYCAGAKFGWYKMEAEIAGGLLALSLASLRSAVGNPAVPAESEKQEPKP